MTRTNRTDGIETLFFRNRHLLWLSVVVILVGGASAIFSLPRLEDPRITNRGPIVITPVPGASAERVETLVTEVLEEALDEIDAIKDIDSTSRAGVSVISIELAPAVTARNNTQLFAEIRDKVGDAAALLPPEAGPPVVDDKRDPAAFTLIVGVSWDFADDLQVGLLNRLAEDLGDRLRNIDGTELVRLYGAPEEEITIEVDRDELAELGLSAASVAAVVGAADAKRPAGTLRGDRSDVLIEVEGELDTVRRIERVPLATNASDAVLAVGDVARVRRGWRTPESAIARVDGRRSVLVAARVAPDVRVDAWAEDADRVLADFESTRAPGIRLDRVFEQEPYTSERLGVLAENMLAGAGVILLAVFVIMGLRPAVIVAVALPLVVALVLFGWKLTGGAIHQMSIFGMIIALGLLIDNAIVMTDEVTSSRARGDAPIEAVGKAVRHLFLPLLASTITTILAFAPIMLLAGSAGDFVGAIGTSVVLAIGASFLVAMTITATLAGIFARPTPTARQRRWYRDGLAPAGLGRWYERTLRRLFATPATAIAIAVALPLAGFVVAPRLGNQFFPPIDRNMFELQMWMPSDTSIGHTVAEAESVEQSLRALDDVAHVSWLVGGSHPTVFYNLVMKQDRSARYAHGIVTTSSPAATKRLIDTAQVRLDRRHPDAQIVVRQLAQGPPVIADIEYRLFGPIDIGAEVMAGLETAGFVLPDGYRLELGGASEQDAEATTNLATHAPVLGTLMVATLILAFRSVWSAMLLGGVAVFSLGLALLSTWSIGFPVSFNTILGTLGLIGVALNDSIVVLAAIRADPRAAAGDHAAVVAAVIGCTRHVVATTATTIGGFLPLLLFVGGDFWPSLAIVLVGGIAGASLLAILFVPGASLLRFRSARRPSSVPRRVAVSSPA